MEHLDFEHPKFSNSQTDKQVVSDDPSNVVVRLEYPDGVIFVYKADEKGNVKVQSNYGFIQKANNVVSPDLNNPNSSFIDVI